MRWIDSASLATLLIGLLGAIFGSTAAFAQIDPSSALLLNGDTPQTSGTVIDSGIDSGRYSIRPKTETSVVKSTKKQPQKVDPSDSLPVTITVPGPGPSPVQKVVEPKTIVLPPSGPHVENPIGKKPESVTNRPSNWGRQNHILDLSLFSGYLYNDSSSTYSYRNYNLAAPALGADALVWINSGFGLHLGYTTTYNATVSDATNGSRSVAVSETWLTLGVRERKFFGLDGVSSSLTYGVDYINFNMSVATEAKSHESLLSSGARFLIEAEIADTPTRSWLMGLTFSPLLVHSEASTSVSFQSGSSVSAASVGAFLGMSYHLSKSDTIFLKFSETIERDVFSGTANLADPVTVSAPSNVSITNSFSILQLGYSWGD